MAGSHHARSSARPPARRPAQAAGSHPDAPLAFAVLLVLATGFGRLAIPAGSQLALVWPAAGFGILWLCATRTRRELLTSLMVLPVLVGAVNLVEGAPPALAGVFAASSTAQAALGWALVEWRRRPRRQGRAAAGQRGSWQLQTTGDLWWLLLVAALSSGASALLVWGGHTLTGFGDASVMTLLGLVVRNTASVIVLVAPLLRLLAGPHAPRGASPRPLGQAGVIERTLMICALAVTYTLVFWINPGLPLAFVVLPLSAWVAVRRPTTVVTLHLLLVSVGMTATTLAGRGVFGGLAPDVRILIVQGFVALISVQSLMLALHRDERDTLMRRGAAAAAHAERQTALLEAVFAAVPHGLSVVDRHGAALMANAAVRDLMGVPPITHASVLERGYDLRHPDGRALLPEELPVARVLAGAPVTSMDLLITTSAHPGGRTLATTAHLLPDSGDEPWSRGVVVAFHDVTETRRAADEVSAARDLLAGVLDGVTEQAIIGTDAHGRITVFNVGAEKMLGWSREEAIGRTPEFLHVAGEVVERARELGIEPGCGVLVHVARREQHETRQWTYVRRDGHQLPVMLSVTALRSGHGRVTGFIGVAQDLTDRLRAQERLAYEASHDALSGLVNRRELVERLHRALASSSAGAPVGVLYLDLDGFKAVNDTAGHDAGDQVLREVAERLRLCTRPVDVVGRLGGDEFAVVCPGVLGPGELRDVAERILLAVDHPISVGEAMVSVGASIGSILGHPADTAADLLHRCEQAMYAAKRAGKNRVVAFAPGVADPGNVLR